MKRSRVDPAGADAPGNDAPGNDAPSSAIAVSLPFVRQHATLLERLQCLGVLSRVASGAKQTGDARARVDAISNCALLASPRLALEHLSALQDKCRDLGRAWSVTPLPFTCALPIALWRHVDGFAQHCDSLRLMATCRQMAVATLGAYPRAHVIAREPRHLLSELRAAPSRFLNVARAEFYKSATPVANGEWAPLIEHVALAFGAAGLPIRTLSMGMSLAHWTELLRCCPNATAIEVGDGAYTDDWLPSDLSRLLDAAKNCTSLVCRVAFDREVADPLRIPARFTHVRVADKVRGGTVFDDPSRLVSLALPTSATGERAFMSKEFSKLERLKQPRLKDAAVIGALPRLRELVVRFFDLFDGLWVPDSLERLDMFRCTMNDVGLAHLLRPESRLVSVRCDECVYRDDYDPSDFRLRSRQAIANSAFALVAKAGGVTPTLRELMLPYDCHLEGTAKVAAFASRSSHIELLGRDSHAAYDPSYGWYGVSRQDAVVPDGLLLLLEANRCVVSFGSRLVFQSECSKNCIHALATDA